VDLRGENRLTPGQNYRRDVTVPPSTFPAMSLLSQRRCVDARCRGGDMLETDRLRRFELKAGGFNRRLRSIE
jgi:hypothetical protein